VGSLFCPHFGKLKICWAEEIARPIWLTRVKKLIWLFLYHRNLLILNVPVDYEKLHQ
jgi:hypothetical protein